MGPRTYTLPVPPRTPRSPAPTPTLFAAAKSAETAPLAERMRPRSLEEYFGQEHLVGEGKLLARAITGDRLPSLVLWGPPGSGKTSLARVVAERTNARFVPFSAVLGNVAELREIVRQAKEALSYEGRRTIVFVDEIHRFNKAQQDAFLPHVEAGTIVLVGATTENPSFAINAALLSRCKVFRLEALSSEALMRILRRALVAEAGLGGSGLAVDEEVLRALAEGACGDARRALTSLEAAAELVRSEGGGRITMDALARADDHRPLLYDKAGDEHYNVVSAFIKSMRGTDPDAAVYWADAHARGGRGPALRRSPHDRLRQRGRGQRGPACADGGHLGGCGLPASRHAGGHLPARARGALPGEHGEVERGEERLAARAASGSGARRAPRAEEAAQRAHAAHARRGLRRRLPIPA
jgi:putative ATPase